MELSTDRNLPWGPGLPACSKRILVPSDPEPGLWPGGPYTLGCFFCTTGLELSAPTRGVARCCECE
eukprot:8932394-Alexandrium_andersonii.AAC.1